MKVGDIINFGNKNYSIEEMEGDWFWGFQLTLKDLETDKISKTSSLVRPKGYYKNSKFKIGEQVRSLRTDEIGTISAFQKNGNVSVSISALKQKTFHQNYLLLEE